MSWPSASDALRFWPEQKPRPSPVRTSARIAASAVISTIAAARPPSKSGVIVEACGLVQRQHADRAIPALLYTGHPVLPLHRRFPHCAIPAGTGQSAFAPALTWLSCILEFGQSH